MRRWRREREGGERGRDDKEKVMRQDSGGMTAGLRKERGGETENGNNSTE